jgi:putative CocE/NonD family hydrolase
MGTEQEVRVRMDDGVELAATLYLPDPAAGPQPCLLEALPYRKDDLTASYAGEYVRLRDEYGYAVCRVDLRGTGSSSGDAVDEYPAREQQDLVALIGWLAEQPWCDGSVGMWGTSYSGFNSLQVACERPPALKAICAIYATDDRWTDDVHWRGGALRLVDLVDYCHYMTAMTMLPPVPALWGDDWRDEWRRRIDRADPWVLTWLRERTDGGYWRHGSVRLDGGTAGYDRIDCAVMIVAGWADGYRNNSFRTVAALRDAGVSHRLLAGPWAHADPAHAIPGPRIDLLPEMVAWWDRWLRGREDALPDDPPAPPGWVDLFVRSSTRPEPALEEHAGWWVRDTWPSPRSGTRTLTLPARPDYPVRPDTGTAAWIDCAGHLPWGLSDDQREDDAGSLVWEWDAEDAVLVGYPIVRLRVGADAPAASLSVKLCDVFPDGTSALVTRGSLDLAFRDDVHGQPDPLDPGVEYEVEVELDACAYAFAPGQRLRLSVAGADWPNTVAPPGPVTLTVHGGKLVLPTWASDGATTPTFTPGAPHSAESPDDVLWSVSRDVLRRTTTCSVRHGGSYDVPHDGRATEEYEGSVSVDRTTFAQHASAVCTYTLTWPGVEVRVRATMEVEVEANHYDVAIDATAHEGATLVATRSWRESLPR